MDAGPTNVSARPSGTAQSEPRATATVRRRRIAWGLVAAIALYVGLRALILATNFEDVVMPNFELYPMGTMAELALRGVHFPARFYYDNAAGQLVIGQLTIPFFALFGPSYMVLKCVPAFLGLLTLVLLWLLLDRNFSRFAANLGAILFAVGPSTLVRYSVVCSGNHFENLFFTTFFLWLFYRHHGRVRTRTSLFLAAFGAGLAIFVFLGALIPVGLCAAVHLGLRGWKRVLRDAPVALAGFAVGIAPLVVINTMTSARGLSFLGAKFAGGGPPRHGTILGRTGEFLGGRMVEAGMFEPAFGLSRTQWGFVFVAAFAVAYAASIPSVSRAVAALARGALRAQGDAEADAFERAKLVPFVLYVPLAGVAFGISNMRLGGYVNNMEAGGYRYYLPTLLFAIVLGAVWTARWWRRGGGARVAAVLLGATFLASGATSLTIPDWTFHEVGNGWRYEGFNFAQMARGLVSAKNHLPTAEIIWRVQQWPPDVRERVVRAIGFNLGTAEAERAFDRRRGTGTYEIERVLAGYPIEWRPLMANGAGTALRWMTRMEARTGDLPSILRRVRPMEGAMFDEVVAGSASTNVGLVQGQEVFDTFSEDTELMTMDTPAMGAFERGCGEWFARLAQRGVPHEVEMVEGFRAHFGKPTFLEGWRRAAEGLEH